MWTIRQEQTEAFREKHLQKFEDEMVEHLKGFSPQHCKVAGEPAVRQVIRMGIENAGKYGFTNRGPVRFYIELMFMLGSYFDTDPQYSWARTALTVPQSMDQMARADRLHSHTKDYLSRVFGPGQQYMIEAMRRLSKTRIEEVVSPNANCEEGILKALGLIYPEKCNYIGQSALRTLAKHGLKLAQSYGFETEKGKALMVGLAFAVGHGFSADPLYGWVGRRLANRRRLDPLQKTEDLYSKSMLYLERVVAEIGSE